MKKSTLKNKADKLFSQIIRSKGRCEICHGVNNLQCAHIVSRRFLSTRWDKDNALCLCAGCHRKGHDNPLWFVENVKKIKGDNYDLIVEKSHQTTTHMKLGDYQDLVERLKEELWTI